MFPVYAEFELFYDVGDFLEPECIGEVLPRSIGYDKESEFLKEHHFVSVDGFRDEAQLVFEAVHIGHHGMDDPTPCSVESFVPNGREEAFGR